MPPKEVLPPQPRYGSSDEDDDVDDEDVTEDSIPASYEVYKGLVAWDLFELDSVS